MEDEPPRFLMLLPREFLCLERVVFVAGTRFFASTELEEFQSPFTFQNPIDATPLGRPPIGAFVSVLSPTLELGQRATLSDGEAEKLHDSV